MAFGQQSGPPASAKQISYLESLLLKAGFTSFRDARRTFGLTQRQGNGKFTSREASALIDQLVNGESPSNINEPKVDVGGSLFPASESAPLQQGGADERLAANQQMLLRGIPAEMLVDELVRRGYKVTPADPF